MHSKAWQKGEAIRKLVPATQGIGHHERMGREPIKHCFIVSKDNWKESASNRTNGAITQAEVDGLKESYFTPCATQHLWS